MPLKVWQQGKTAKPLQIQERNVVRACSYSKEKMVKGARFITCNNPKCNKIIRIDPDDFIIDQGKFYCNDIKCHKAATNVKLKK